MQDVDSTMISSQRFIKISESCSVLLGVPIQASSAACYQHKQAARRAAGAKGCTASEKQPAQPKVSCSYGLREAAATISACYVSAGMLCTAHQAVRVRPDVGEGTQAVRDGRARAERGERRAAGRCLGGSCTGEGKEDGAWHCMAPEVDPFIGVMEDAWLVSGAGEWVRVLALYMLNCMMPQ